MLNNIQRWIRNLAVTRGSYEHVKEKKWRRRLRRGKRSRKLNTPSFLSNQILLKSGPDWYKNPIGQHCTGSNSTIGLTLSWERCLHHSLQSGMKSQKCYKPPIGQHTGSNTTIGRHYCILRSWVYLHHINSLITKWEERWGIASCFFRQFVYILSFIIL